MKAGDQMMTPIAKWYEFHKDGTYAGGNGWLQNSQGTYTYDVPSRLFLPTETQGLADPFGPFTVTLSADGMEWERMEEGAAVVVTLQRVNTRPRGYSDQVTGMWGLTDVMEGEVSVTETFDPEGKHSLYLGWDRIYRGRNPQGDRESGYWHAHAHKMEITLLPHQEGQAPETWQVQVEDEQLVLTGISETNMAVVRIYQRLREWPQ